MCGIFLCTIKKQICEKANNGPMTVVQKTLSFFELYLTVMDYILQTTCQIRIHLSLKTNIQIRGNSTWKKALHRMSNRIDVFKKTCRTDLDWNLSCSFQLKHLRLWVSVTRLGIFWQNILLTKVAKIFVNCLLFWGYFKSITFD